MPNANLEYFEATVVEGDERSTNDASDTLAGYGGFSSLRFHVLLVEASVSGGLVMGLEDTVDGTNWTPVLDSGGIPVGSFKTFNTAVDNHVVSFNVTEPFADRVRVTWQVQSGGAVTFAVGVAAQGPAT